VVIGCILNLVRRGHQDQIVVGGDIARRTMYCNYGEGRLGRRIRTSAWRNQNPFLQ